MLVYLSDNFPADTGVVIPLRANAPPIGVMNPLVDVPGHGSLVLSTDEIFTIVNTRLRNPVGSLGTEDRLKTKPAIDLVIGDF